MDVTGIMSQLLTSQMQMIQQSAAVSAIKASNQAEQATVALVQEAAQANRMMPVSADATRGSVIDISV